MSMQRIITKESRENWILYTMIFHGFSTVLVFVVRDFHKVINEEMEENEEEEQKSQLEK
ncbi:hypothetical protein Syun_017085 [Stephania yunnanensis]|uniref:Uncharacterized protein n=1 Tax=Stephania yunnanensis TaxID=152371 RepID=A0AAP0P2R3_9MAGN